MAIQARMYQDSSGFPLRDDMCLNLQRQQFQSRNPELRNAQVENRRLGCLVEKQSMEIDQYIVSQTERLRLVLREKRKRDGAELLMKIEARTRVLLEQKDEEIARAASRTSQLESFINELQTENQTWQQIARTNELHVMNLNNSIQQSAAAAAAHGGENNQAAVVVSDTESCCDAPSTLERRLTELEQEQQSSLKLKTLCKMCRTRNISVVFLPCRHLCSCAICDPFIDFCPVCQTEKKASVEALFH